jgi:hypothetical protein
VSVRQSVFANNVLVASSSDARLALVYAWTTNTTVTVEGCTAYNNIYKWAPKPNPPNPLPLQPATLYRGATMYCDCGAICSFRNGISWDSDAAGQGDRLTAIANGPHCGIDAVPDVKLAVTYSDVFGAIPTANPNTNNIALDPKARGCTRRPRGPRGLGRARPARGRSLTLACRRARGGGSRRRARLGP